MVFQKDFRDLCSLLNEEKIDYLIVGAYAVAFHGVPRATGDFDVLVRPDEEHVQRLLRAVRAFGFPIDNVTAGYVLTHGKILQLGRVPVQIHIMTSITGVSWDSAWASRVDGVYGKVPVFFIGLAALMTNKTAAGRSKDLADVKALQRKGES